MKKILLIALLLPSFSFANEYSEEFYAQIENEDVQIMFNNCGAFSDQACWGRRVGTTCKLNNTPNAPWGQCRQTGQPDRRGDVPCRCL